MKQPPSSREEGGNGKARVTAAKLRSGPNQYFQRIQNLLRQAKSQDKARANDALVELFRRFHLRLPLEEARLGFKRT